jgi:signal transduction histidine kinase
VLVFNYDPYYYWFRIIVKNNQSADRQLMLLMAPVGLYNGQLYQKTNGKWNEIARAGLKYKFADRTYQFTHHVFPFTLPPNSTDTLYLSLDASNVYKSFGFALIQPKELKIFENNIYLVFGIIIGLLLLFFVLNIALFLALRERLHLWYALYIALLFFIVMKNDQLDQEFLALDSEKAFRLTPYLAIGAFAIAVLMYVVRHFLKTTLIHNRLLYRLTVILEINVLCSAVAHAIVFLFVHDWRIETIVFIWGKNSILLCTLIIIVDGIYCISKKHRGAWFIFCGSLVFLIGSVQRLFFPSTLSFLFPPTTFHVGIMMETFIISMGLIYRYWLEKEAQRQREMTLEMQIRDDISREIHDNVAQLLTVVKLGLTQTPSIKTIINADDDIKKLTLGPLQEAVEELRNLARILKGEPVKAETVINKIEKKCKDFNALKLASVKCSFEGTASDMDYKKYEHITRILQESLNNILKHAHASNVDVSMKFNANHLEMKIADDGQGFDMSIIKKGNGLQNIQERCTKLNATYNHTSEKNKGTQICISVPLD